MHEHPTDAQVEAEAEAIYPDTNPGPPTPEEIAREAHAIYLSRGATHGRDLDDWLEAERRLTERRADAGPKSAAAGWRERQAERLAHGEDDLKA